MELTGKAKEQFEKWYIKTECKDFNLLWQIRTEFKMFYNVLTDSMQWGVYEGYFLEIHGVGISLDMYTHKIRIIDYYEEEEISYIDCEELQYMELDPTELLNAYWTAAIEKANEIVNNR